MNDTPAPGALRRLFDKVFYAGCSSTETDRRNVRHMNLVAFTWAVTYCVATYFLRGGFNLPLAVAAILVAIPATLGAIMLWSWVRFLRGCDEMMRKLHLEALAIGFGITVLAIITASLLQAAGVPPLSINSLLAIAAFAYMSGVAYSTRRYR